MTASQAEAYESDVQSQDLLKLLQQLAQRHPKKDPLQHAPATSMDTTLASYLAGIVDDTSDHNAKAQAQVPSRNKGSRLKWIAIAGCLAILAAGTLGLSLFYPFVAAEDGGRTKMALPAPSGQDSIPAAEARASRASVPIATECDLPGLDADPDATYVVMTPMPLSSNGRRTSELSGEDRGWYSLMSLMARPELRNAGC